MNLDQQIDSLILNAPQDGTTPQIVEAISPALKLLAQQLRHLHYYILESPERGWVLTTLSHRHQPERQKRVIYAFPTKGDALSFRMSTKSPEQAIAVPVTHILFQMSAIPHLDSLVFFEVPGELQNGIEVTRPQVEDLIHTYLTIYQSKSTPIPPDLA